MKSTSKWENAGPVASLGPKKRRQRSKAERRRIVEETLVAGTSVAVIARSHGVNANQVFHWRKLYRAGLLDEHPVSPQFLQARIIDPGQAKQRTGADPDNQCSGTIDIQLGGVRVRITGAADPDCIRAALEQMR